ncbi:hypothetical protein [Thiolapillus brandeum]|uniref:Uncharacterized protein n=1 Tax=Thiolapillus brandeum TaxID=1076588 RepID=A0A7U6GG32_9GAMM|nr:hypothetical protein [Thiolapillus brandeum]BAO42972.1 hypothetical protein TBH_C0021 [Thiolapillus brandeum]
MNAWSIMGIFESLESSGEPTRTALRALSDSGNKETPSEQWKELPEIVREEHLSSFVEWVRTIYLHAGKTKNTRSVFFLLEEDYVDGSVLSDLHAYPSEEKHTSDSYEEWSKGESFGSSQNEAFRTISEAVNKFIDINGMSHYSIPLLYSGAAIYEATIRVCEDPSFMLDQSLTIAVGYFYGDCFHLGKISKRLFKSSMSFKLKVERLR